MTTAVFRAYLDYDERERLARLELEDGIPLNISLDRGSDTDLREGERCTVRLWTNDYAVDVYASEEEYREAALPTDLLSMIPTGTFPSDPKDMYSGQAASILFSGIVREVVRNPAPKEGEPVCMLQVETYAMRFDLFSFEDDGIEPGFVLHGEAWIFGTLKRA